MGQLTGKAAYIKELIKVGTFLPTVYMKDVQALIPHKSIGRIKNARTGIVQDAEVLIALQTVAERERQRRMSAVKAELKALRG